MELWNWDEIFELCKLNTQIYESFVEPVAVETIPVTVGGDNCFYGYD